MWVPISLLEKSILEHGDHGFLLALSFWRLVHQAAKLYKLNSDTKDAKRNPKVRINGNLVCCSRTQVGFHVFWIPIYSFEVLPFSGHCGAVFLVLLILAIWYYFGNMLLKNQSASWTYVSHNKDSEDVFLCKHSLGYSVASPLQRQPWALLPLYSRLHKPTLETVSWWGKPAVPEY